MPQVSEIIIWNVQPNTLRKLTDLFEFCILACKCLSRSTDIQVFLLQEKMKEETETMLHRRDELRSKIEAIK